jgi:hypothetical protein
MNKFIYVFKETQFAVFDFCSDQMFSAVLHTHMWVQPTITID